MLDYRRYLQPEYVASFASLELRGRMIVEGYLAGSHRSRRYGASTEFLEHREYRPGDDPRLIDWRAYGRTDRYVVKRFEAEQSRRSWVLLDASSSMAWSGEGPTTKYEYGLSLAAGLSFMLLRRGDAVGAARFDTEPRQIVPPSSRPSHIHPLLGTLAEEPPEREGRTDIGGALGRISERTGRSGLVVVISDLIDEPSVVMRGLAALRARRHEVVVLQVLDPIERSATLPPGGRYRDVETGRVIDADPERDAADYRRRVEAFLAAIGDGCRGRGIRRSILTTDRPFDRGLHEVCRQFG